MTALALIVLALAAWPAVLFIRNLRVFNLRTEAAARTGNDVSILIPARNEETNIRLAAEAALANSDAEIIVLDDLSTDRTAEVVEELSKINSRLQLIRGAELPRGWCGKNWACAQLSEAATRPLLLFVDADVRLAPNAAARLAAWIRANGAQLASGVPRQELGTFSERLLIPLIHFVLLGFLPLDRMRRSRHPAYATGCGQLMLADAAAYETVGGHAAIRDRIHDGLALPRAFRKSGLRTDLFDATDVATCRMYRTNRATWRGLAKNTHEGIGAPGRIVPFTVILFGGQVVPFLLLAVSSWLSFFQISCAVAAVVCALAPRVIAANRFHQPFAAVFLHPIGVAALLAIQWWGLLRHMAQRPSTWKGRSYPASGAKAIAVEN